MRIALAVSVAFGAALLTAGGPAAQGPAAAPQAPEAAAAYDFGDAPDGAPARYAEKPRVRGAFPSRGARGGPRHPLSGPHIGTGWSSETDSRQVDADADDGARLNARSCAVSTLSVVVDATRAEPGAPIYLNAWFDWNQDGDWADGGTQRCSPEWAIQNMRVDPASLGADRIALLTLRFRAGRVPNEFWWRVQVHSGEPVPHLGSGGQTNATRGGESEDWFFSRIPPLRSPKPQLICRAFGGGSNVDVRPHGDSPAFLFQFVGIGSARLSARQVRHKVTGALDGIVVVRRRDLDVPHREWVLMVQRTPVHRRDPDKQVVRIQLDIEALVNGRLRKYSSVCQLELYHIVRITPPVDPPKERKAVRRGITPQNADCRARFAPTPSGGAAVDVRCYGGDAKLVSVDSGNTRKVRSFRNRGAVWNCEMAVGIRVIRCFFRPRNKGRVIGIDYEADPPYNRGTGHVVIHVLAGGSAASKGGTAIVLRQSWFIYTSGRIECRQYVPDYGTCPPL